MTAYVEHEISFHDVHLRRGSTLVLSGLSLAVERGETLVLVGRSGVGKSSILKLINRLIHPDSGDVIVRGRSTRVWDPFVLRRQIGYVLQEVGLLPHLSVSGNVAVVPRLLAWSEERVRARVVEMLDLVGLPPQEFGARFPHELSGGQRQRVGVARALAADPPVLLMDEPFGALDPVTRSEIHAEFQRIQSQVRKTVVLVTHDMAEALALATRVGVLVDGGLIALDAPAAVARMADTRVRSLLAPLREAAEALGGRR